MTPTLRLRLHKDKAIQRGYPWVFANQTHRPPDGLSRGDVVRLETHDGAALGLGLYHDTSLIRARFLTTDVERAVDAGFWAERVNRAADLREAAFPGATHARVLFGESDGVPGTVVDRYGDVLTWTCLSAGVEGRRGEVLDALRARFRPRAIVERNDAPLREKDGLEQRAGLIEGEFNGEVEVEEEGVRFGVDPLHGPKTGFFIDQRPNRLALRPFARGRRVLDVFCADGGFGLHAAAAGAERVHFLDVSEAALARVRANAERSGLGAARLSFEAGDALDRIDEAAQGFDFIVLDPPGFAQSRRHVERATAAYQRINIAALQALPAGGLLYTASCSQAVSEADFLRIIQYSARKAGAALRLLYRGNQPPDHPVLESMPETHYLKGFLFQKLTDEMPGL